MTLINVDRIVIDAVVIDEQSIMVRVASRIRTMLEREREVPNRATRINIRTDSSGGR